jgi:hypothetical protein
MKPYAMTDLQLWVLTHISNLQMRQTRIFVNGRYITDLRIYNRCVRSPVQTMRRRRLLKCAQWPVKNQIVRTPAGERALWDSIYAAQIESLSS